MSNNSNNDVVLVAIAVAALVLAFVVFKFSSLLHVDFETGLSIFGRCTGIILISVVFAKLDFIPIGAILPVSCSGMMWGFFPALDYWSAHEVGNLQLGFDLIEPAWYAQVYSKVGFMLIPLVGGYMIRYIRSR